MSANQESNLLLPCYAGVMLDGQSIEEFMEGEKAYARIRHILAGYIEATPEEEADFNQKYPGWKISALEQRIDREESSLHAFDYLLPPTSDPEVLQRRETALVRQRELITQLKERLYALMAEQGV